MKKIMIIVSGLFFIGCHHVKPTIPEGYSGPISIVEDSVKKYSTSKVDFFIIEKLNNEGVNNSRDLTLNSNSGQGMRMKVYMSETKLPSKKCIISITGISTYAAPILALTGTIYKISGDIEFTPKANTTYIVKGILGEKYSAVWLEDKESQEIIGKKIESHKSTALGFFEK